MCLDFANPCTADPPACPAKGETCSFKPKPPIQWPHIVEQGLIVGVVENWGPTMSASFDLKIKGILSEESSIFEVKDETGESISYGFAKIFFRTFLVRDRVIN